MTSFDEHANGSASMSRRHALALLGAAGACALAVSGEVIAPVRQAKAASGDFVFPRSAYELLTYNDLYHLSEYELYIARNEIFARHGYIFVSADLNQRFNAMEWYVPLYTESTFSWDVLNQIEQSNIALIQEQEAVLRGEISGEFGQDANNTIYTSYFEFVLPEYWRGYVDVLYEYEEGSVVSIAYRGNPDQPLVWFKVVDGGSELRQGDIATSLIAWWSNGRGQRIEMWGRNYVYVTNIAAGGYIAYPYPNAVAEAALIDLSTGGSWTVDRAKYAANNSLDGLTYYWDAFVPKVTVY